jgi:hypothetical protein
LYPLPHDGIRLTLKRLLQALYLVLPAFDHLAPQNQMVFEESHPESCA